MDSKTESTLLVSVEIVCWDDSCWARKASREAVNEVKRDLCSGSVRMQVSYRVKDLSSLSSMSPWAL